MADGIRLARCPMCGAAAVALVEAAGGEYSVRVECSGCHVCTPRIVYAKAKPLFQRDKHIELRLRLALAEAREEAAAVWNRRTENGPTFSALR